MSKSTTQQAALHDAWLAEPNPDHLVHFYPFDNTLLESLTEYFYHGLSIGDTCIAIATPDHIAGVNAKLRAKGVDLSGVIENGQYIMLDANNTLSAFMINKLPAQKMLAETIGRTIILAAGRGKPIRAFGEMVAILWEAENLNGLLQLEEYWHSLVTEHSFSLYCAYPSTLFDSTSTLHKEAISNICKRHSLTLGYAAA